MWGVLNRGHGIDALERVERPTPTPGPREVLVRMSAASLNDRDLLVIGGVEGWKPREARIPISDGVGVVVAVGAAVTRFHTGQRVSGTSCPGGSTVS